MLQKKKKGWMRLIVVTLTVNKLPDYPTCSFIDWQGFCEFFGLVSNLTCHICYKGCIHQQGHSGVAPEATTPCQSLLHQSKPRLALAGASRGGKEGARLSPLQSNSRFKSQIWPCHCECSDACPLQLNFISFSSGTALLPPKCTTCET